MNILSLFDGMSCGQIALNRVGIKYDNYYASEIDKYAIQVTQHNYPNTIQLGDINNWQEWKLPETDLIMGGSPCQGFGLAGKRLNFDDPRSKLYFVFEDIVKHYQPKWWLLENVVMIQEWQDVISRRLGIRPIMINSALVSAQNRERLYWTNIGNELDLFGLPYCNISQPADKKIVLVDIIEDGFVDRQKSFCLVESYNKTSDGGDSALDRYTRKKSGQIVFNQPVLIDTINDSQDGKVVSPNGKSFTLVAGHNNWPKIATWNYRIDTPIDMNSSKYPTLRANAGGKTRGIGIANPSKNTWRKLSPLECERLQTVSDNYTLISDENGKQLVSNAQRYKMLGNGWTVDVIAHIFSFLITETETI